MSAPCAVCGAATEVIYRSEQGQALTSLCTLLDQPTEVTACRSCAHLQTPPIGDLEAYYATAYRILLASEEEDQIYEVGDGAITYRAAHQATTMLSRVDLPVGARVLDYGAAKGATMRRVRDARPDVSVHLFDVSDMYVEHWKALVEDDAWATFETPRPWAGSFDLVASFFMLEHVEHPAEVVAALFALVRPGGSVHCVVPDPFVNVADLIVVDHTNHFTGPSLQRLFSDCGFDGVRVDGSAHTGAWVVTARRPVVAEEHDAVLPSPSAVAEAFDRSTEVASYWGSAREVVRRAEATALDDAGSGALAIYGAGFYGSFIRANLRHPEAVVAYVDQSPHLIGTEHDGRPVVSPADLPSVVGHVIVGLNPLLARSIIEEIPAWQDRDLHLHFL
ncbi:hypothetical protein BH10ACT1_BH10ACT1_28660 [soil metagenome]